MFDNDKVLMEKWAPVLNHEGTPEISDLHRKSVTARLLENTENALKEEAAQRTYSISEGAGTGVASAAEPDPVLISLVRRAMPSLVAYDIAGVQPMTGPTGLIFVMKARYGDAAGTAVGSLADVTTSQTEALGVTRADTDFSNSSGSSTGDVAPIAASNADIATGTATAVTGKVYQVLVAGDYTARHAGTNATSAVGDVIIANANGAFGSGLKAIDLGVYAGGSAAATAEDAVPANMGFTIEKIATTAVTRQLKAEYTMELAQDLKSVHGLDAEAELSNILSTEILAEINREVIGKVIQIAKRGQVGATKGLLTLSSTSADVNGARWQAERHKALAFRLEQEASGIGKDTRRGKGNFILCSSNVAAALNASGSLDAAPGGLNIDTVGNTFAGTMSNGMKVYVDVYSDFDYAIVGYKGTNSFDAGLYYCPYVPLTMMKAQSESTFQPKIGFKTRYALQVNPFASTEDNFAIEQADASTTVGTNQYYRFNGVVGI